MTIDDLVTLTKAGFTKDDITHFLTPAPAPSEPSAPAPAETPAPAPAEQPTPAEPASEGADLKTMFENYLQQMQGTLNAIQAGNIRNDGQPPKVEENPFIKYLP